MTRLLIPRRLSAFFFAIFLCFSRLEHRAIAGRMFMPDIYWLVATVPLQAVGFAMYSYGHTVNWFLGEGIAHLELPIHVGAE